MKKHLTILMVVCLLTASLAFAGCSPQATQTPTGTGETVVVRIGAIVPLTGGTAFFGECQKAGYELAMDYINENGGIKSLGGAQIELIVADSQGKPEVGTTEFERLVTVENVDAMIGTYNSNVAAACAPLAIKYKVPFQVTNAVDDAIMATDSNYVFRANPGNKDGIASTLAYIEWCREELGRPMKKYTMIYDQSDYGKGVYDTAVANKDLYGYETIYGEPISAGSSDLSTQINRLKGSDSEWVNPTVALDDALLFIRQMKQYNVSMLVSASGGGFLANDFFEKAGDLAEYCVSTAHWFPDQLNTSFNPTLANQINDKYKAKYGYDMNESVANGWLGMMCLLDAIERAGSVDREDIAKAMDETNLPANHLALLFHGYGGVKYEDFDGRFNQNKYAQISFAQVHDAAYRVFFPREIANPDYEFVWQPPAWDER